MVGVLLEGSVSAGQSCDTLRDGEAAMNAAKRANWASGFLRVWLNLSMLWILIVLWAAAITGRTVWSWQSPLTVQVGYSYSEIWEFPAGLGNNGIKLEASDREGTGGEVA